MSHHSINLHNRDLGKLIRLSETVAVMQGFQWQCNNLVVRKDGHALTGDSSWNPNDLEVVADMVKDHDTHFLLTHADIDHACTIGSFDHAKVVACPLSNERVEDGTAALDVRVESAKWDLEFKGEPRVDMVVNPGDRIKLGVWNVTTFDTPGHALYKGDGIAYLIEEEGVFMVGDYLSDNHHPMIWHSINEARDTVAHLIDIIQTRDMQHIVSGHGSVHNVEQAIAVGKADHEYLSEVARVAAYCAKNKLTHREWHMAIESVPTPRRNEPDIGLLCPRLINAASSFADHNIDPDLPWVMDMA